MLVGLRVWGGVVNPTCAKACESPKHGPMCSRTFVSILARGRMLQIAQSCAAHGRSMITNYHHHLHPYNTIDNDSNALSPKTSNPGNPKALKPPECRAPIAVSSTASSDYER